MGVAGGCVAAGGEVAEGKGGGRDGDDDLARGGGEVRGAEVEAHREGE